MAGRRQSFRPRPIDVYKPLPLVRQTEDLEFTDEAGTTSTILQKDILALNAEDRPAKRKRLNIPVPMLLEVPKYEETIAANYRVPLGFIRYQKLTPADEERLVEYDLTAEDDEWLRNHPRYGAKGDPRYQLASGMMARMIDVLEKASGKIAPQLIGQREAEELFVRKLSLYRSATNKVSVDVYQYWVAKRHKLKKPLLRRFWRPTSMNDTNPHLVFRPREKERYKLRKHRKNDMDAFRKMQQLRHDLERARRLMELIQRRETIKAVLTRYQLDGFRQQLQQAGIAVPASLALCRGGVGSAEDATGPGAGAGAAMGAGSGAGVGAGGG
eukprot:g5013.t1